MTKKRKSKLKFVVEQASIGCQRGFVRLNLTATRPEKEIDGYGIDSMDLEDCVELFTEAIKVRDKLKK